MQLLLLLIVLPSRNENFSILARGFFSFHLSALEATFIESLNPFCGNKKNSSTL